MDFIDGGEGRALHVAHRPATGGAVTLAFSNSLATDFRVWDPLVAALPPSLGVLRYDSRGHGLSSLGATPYTLDDHVADASAVIEWAGGLVVFVGLSVGGLIAQGMALRRPDLLSAVALVCSGARIMDEARWTARMAEVASSGLEPLLEGNMARWFTPAFRTPDNALFEGMCSMFRRQSSEAYIATAATLRDTDLRGEVGTIALPTLAVAGEHDGSTPPDLVEATANLIPGARYVCLSDCAHIPCVEAPDALAATLVSFLQDNGLSHGG